MRTTILALLFWFTLTQTIAVPNATPPMPAIVQGTLFIGGFLTLVECNAARELLTTHARNGRGGYSITVCYQSEGVPQVPPGP